MPCKRSSVYIIILSCSTCNVHQCLIARMWCVLLLAMFTYMHACVIICSSDRLCVCCVCWSSISFISPKVVFIFRLLSHKTFLIRHATLLTAFTSLLWNQLDTFTGMMCTESMKIAKWWLGSYMYFIVGEKLYGRAVLQSYDVVILVSLLLYINNNIHRLLSRT